MRHISLSLIVYVFVVFAILYGLTLLFGWFDTIAWFDVPMHLIGGMWIGLVFLYLFSGFFQSDVYAHHAERVKVLLLGIGFAAFIGILWEFFEFGLDAFFSLALQVSVADNMKDLLMDIIGGGVVVAWALFYHRSRTKSDASAIPVM